MYINMYNFKYLPRSLIQLVFKNDIPNRINTKIMNFIKIVWIK